MAGITLDAGALIAAERGTARFWGYWKKAVADGVPVVVPASVLAEAWRGPRNARMAMVLRGCRVEPLTPLLARRAGELCGRAGSQDSVDAIVVTSAALRGDAIITSDPADLRQLVTVLGRRIDVIDLR